jgi:hypothetical protein
VEHLADRSDLQQIIPDNPLNLEIGQLLTSPDGKRIGGTIWIDDGHRPSDNWHAFRARAP